MYVLFETAGGFALFKVLQEKKLKNVEDLHKCFETPEKASEVVKLKSFARFKDTADAMKSLEKLIKGKLSKSLSKFLSKHMVQKEIEDELLVCEMKLGKAITEKLGISCKTGEKVNELMRCIRFQMQSLVKGLDDTEQLKAMQLGLAHSMSRYTLAFSSDKVDTMVIQAVALLEDLDKELNNYAMRLKEWYGWHFPELAKILTDNVIYAQAVNMIGKKTTVKDISEEKLMEIVMDENIAREVKEAAEISMGTEILDEDVKHLRNLAVQVVEISAYRANLAEYLKTRMQAVAPNLTALIGELVASKLISHAGGLIKLAKQPASTIQILGAEKALFRALKQKKSTPKYGLIYNASLVGSATNTKLKGKISRSLAAKAALCVRSDALAEDCDGTMGIKNKAYLEGRLKLLEAGGTVVKKAFAGGAQAVHSSGLGEKRGYNDQADYVPYKRQKFE